jgi:ubiquinone/menaquinone biosynthesis C-methylase UbiE
VTNCDYSILDEHEARKRSADGWLSRRTAWRQERAYRQLLAEMRSGRPRIDFKVAAEAVEAACLTRARLLEVGCGNGYYNEVFAHFLGDRIDYSGIDYSDAMIARARRAYPHRRFDVGSATALPYPNESIEIVFNGASLLHILDYDKAIAESRRVAQVACIFHTVPLFHERATTYLHKYAYGGPVVEIIFNRSALIGCFSRHGLVVERSWNAIPYDVSQVTGEHSFTETFLCRPK